MMLAEVQSLREITGSMPVRLFDDSGALPLLQYLRSNAGHADVVRWRNEFIRMITRFGNRYRKIEHLQRIERLNDAVSRTWESTDSAVEKSVEMFLGKADFEHWLESAGEWLEETGYFLQSLSRIEAAALANETLSPEIQYEFEVCYDLSGSLSGGLGQLEKALNGLDKWVKDSRLVVELIHYKNQARKLKLGLRCFDGVVSLTLSQYEFLCYISYSGVAKDVHKNLVSRLTEKERRLSPFLRKNKRTKGIYGHNTVEVRLIDSIILNRINPAWSPPQKFPAKSSSKK